MNTTITLTPATGWTISTTPNPDGSLTLTAAEVPVSPPPAPPPSPPPVSPPPAPPPPLPPVSPPPAPPPAPAGLKPVQAFGPVAAPTLLNPPDFMPWNGTLPHNAVVPFPYEYEPPFSSGKQTADATFWGSWYQLPFTGFIEMYGDNGVPYFDVNGVCQNWFHQDVSTAEQGVNAFAGAFAEIDRAGGRGDYYQSPVATYCCSSMGKGKPVCWTYITIYGQLGGLDDADGKKTIFVPAGTAFRNPTDLCPDPRQAGAQSIHYVADGGNNRVAKVDLATTPPTITDYAVSLHNPTSVAMANDGTMYVADHDADRIAVVSPDGTISTLKIAAPIYAPFCLRLTSKGQIVVASDVDSHLGIYLIDPGTGAVSPVLVVPGSQQTKTAPTADQRGKRNWVWFDVDKTGSCGPVDDVFYAVSLQSAGLTGYTLPNGGTLQNFSGGFNDVVARVSLDGTRFAQLTPVFNTGSLQGPHYVWAVVIHPTEAKFGTSGFGTFAGFVLHRPVRATDPQYATTSAGTQNPGWTWELQGYTQEGKILSQARQIMLTGTSLDSTAVAGRPPLAQVLGLWGLQFLGNPTFEQMASSWTKDKFAAFVQAGAGGTTPRPELTGKWIDILWYYVQRCSLQAWLRQIPLPAV